MNEVRVTNMTSLFSKEMLMYSFFDIRLKAPLRVSQILYFILLSLGLGVPVFALLPFNVYTVGFVAGGAFGGSSLMSKPIWQGKSFKSFLKTNIKYYTRPKVLYDWRGPKPDNEYFVDSTITVSRHDDYKFLYNMVKKEEEELING